MNVVRESLGPIQGFSNSLRRSSFAAPQTVYVPIHLPAA